MSFIKLFPQAFRNKLPWLPVVCGSLLALSAPGYNQWWLAWFALTPALLWIEKQTSKANILWGGFCFGFLFQGIYCIWLFNLHPLTWIGFSDWASRFITLMAWLLISTEGGLLLALLFFAYSSLKQKTLLRSLIFPMLWVLGFQCLHLSPLALPWGLLEYTQASFPFIRTLMGIVTPSVISALIVVHNCYWVTRPKLWCGAALLPLILWSSQFWYHPSNPKTPLNLPVAVIQANLPIEVIRSSRLSSQQVETAYISPLERATLPIGTLVVFPEEGVVPGLVSMRTPEQNLVLQKLIKIAEQKKIWIAVGVSSYSLTEQLHNSIFMLAPTGKIQAYHKHRLVPFGETTPYGLGDTLTHFLNSLGIAYSAPFTPGSVAEPMTLGPAKVGGLVCFELIEGQLLGNLAHHYSKQGVDLLVNTSNLGWFHNNPLMEAQFLAIGQTRSAEAHVPLIIASNTGISAILNSNGHVLTHTQPFLPQATKTQIIFTRL